MTKLRQDQSNAIEVSIPFANGQRVVLVETSGRPDLPALEHNANIYRIDAELNIIWQVSAGEPKFESDAFIYLQRKGRVLRAQMFGGFIYRIDPKTGIAKCIGWEK